jgi:pyruvate dehydrogenase E1 component beta subunit
MLDNPNNYNKKTYSEAIQDAISIAMERNVNVVLIGEGVPDPKRIFGTTAGLLEKYGANRVFDSPLSENGITGICVGASLMGLRPILVHQRVDFALLSMDQLVNNAAKWHYMFNQQSSIPMVVRMIVGRGWGQGPQHSQSLQALFAHIPGLKVVMPATGYDVKGMLLAAIEDNNPVVFIEHRWLHPVKDNVPEGYYKVALNKARVVRYGTRLTIAAFSYAVLEALKVANLMHKFCGIDIEVVDMRSISPLDSDTVLESVKKTKNLLIVDTAHVFGGIGGELMAQIIEKGFHYLENPPARIGLPNFPSPTSNFMMSEYYPNTRSMIIQIDSMLGINSFNDSLISALSDLERKQAHDVPDQSFTGPF